MVSLAQSPHNDVLWQVLRLDWDHVPYAQIQSAGDLIGFTG